MSLLMEAVAPYFDYKTDIYFAACNNYKIDVLNRLNAIRVQHPEAFANLAFGDITSGDYQIAITGSTAGHVGVVVYEKGTNYRETGIIINGTPTPSPLNAVSEIGPADPGAGFGLAGWTGLNGLYLRTPANKFPGMPQQEKPRGFEGMYDSNSTEFTYGGVPAAPEPTDPAPTSCPMAPDAVAIGTESPVDLIITNGEGKRVVTENGILITQELGTGVVSMAFPHGDGTFAWTIALPADDYKVQLRGTGTGPYKLTLTTFDADGTPHADVTNGTTAPGQMNEYTLDAPEVVVPPVTPPVTPPATPATPAPADRGGGGSVDVLLLAALSLIITSRLIATRRRRKQA